MKDIEILDAMSQILRELLGDNAVTLTPQTRRHDVPGWDSFNYVNFIVAVELQFKIKFRVAEVESFETVGDIVARTLALLSSRRS
jgi:acyl carrier protein